MPIAPAAAVGTLRLRLRAAPGAADTPALRLRAARELAGAELAPAGLAPAAMLLVRRVADPLPGGFGGGGGRPCSEWERAVRDELAAAARAAARPDARGRLPAGAAAVLFADDAELLACLLADRARGEHAGRWWWRVLLPRLAASWRPAAGGSDPAPLLAACPRELPAAFAHLAHWGEAGPVAASLGAAGARRALAALVREHDLSPALLPGGGGGVPEARGSWPASGEPWREWLAPAAAAAATAPEARALAGVALGLVHAPGRVRSSPFAAAVRRWWRAAGDDFRHPSPVRDPRQVFGQAGEAFLTPKALRAGTPAAQRAKQAARGESPLPPTADGSRAPGAAPPGPRLRPAGAVEASAPRPPEAAPLPAAPLRASGETVTTRLAGLLYLIHLMADLNLPAAAERGWRLASEAGPWGTLDLLGRGLLAHRFPELSGDPLWRSLAALAGWTDAAPGAESHDTLADVPARDGPARRPPDRRDATRDDPAWRAPADWAARLDDPLDACRWSAAQGRLRLWSAAGWLLADVPRRAEPPSRQARRELARTAAAAARRRDAATVLSLRRGPAAAAPLSPLPPLAPGCPPRLGRWAAAAVPAVRRRLLLALDADAGGWDPVRGAAGDPVDRLLVLPGTLHLTSSHLDLVLDGEHADVATRRAGLDRDPGWVPALGRVVLFHFL